MKERYYSLDVFRGATVALMILVNNPGNWSYIYSPFEHAAWHGCTPTDLVFPFFLFAVGNAMAFVLPQLKAKGTSAFLQKVFIRSLLIFGIGLFLSWSPFIKWDNNHIVFKGWANIRIFGVLQRIALCYLFASLIVYFFKSKGTIIISIAVLLLYWFLCYHFGSLHDPYSLEGYFGTAVDKALLGINHMYKGEGIAFDPEGISSTLPGIVQVVFGYLAGKYIKEKGKSWEMLTHLFIGGVLLIFVGFCWDMLFPINKKIWTSSYVIYTTGLALMVIGVMIFFIEFKNRRGAISSFFSVFGKNALFIFAFHVLFMRLQGLIRIIDQKDEAGKPIYITPMNWFYKHLCNPISTVPRNGSLFYAICMMVFFWVIVFWMDKKKIYLKV